MTTALPELTLEFPLHAVPTDSEENIDKEEAAARMVRGWLTLTGPVTVNRLAELIPLSFTMLATAWRARRPRAKSSKGDILGIYRDRMVRPALAGPHPSSDAGAAKKRSRSRSPRPTSCGSCCVGSIRRRERGSTARRACWPCSVNCRAARWLPRLGGGDSSARVSGYDPQWLDRLCFGARSAGRGCHRIRQVSTQRPREFRERGSLQTRRSGKRAAKIETPHPTHAPCAHHPLPPRRDAVAFFRGVGEKAAAEKEALLSNLSRRSARRPRTSIGA